MQWRQKLRYLIKYTSFAEIAIDKLKLTLRTMELGNTSAANARLEKLIKEKDKL